ncbi:MAG TPA: membrane protein insertase YidC [Gemmatimonadales bacterium]|nr:membrane protein insertase YidC [Gemmatimonadales bacterium]
MERRTLLAIALAMLVALLPSILFPPRRGALPAGAGAPVESPDSGGSAAHAPVAPIDTVAAVVPHRADSVAGAGRDVVVRSPLYRMVFSPLGARLVGAELLEFRSFAAGDSGAGGAQLAPDPSEFLAYRLVVGRDTLQLADWQFQASAESVDVGPGGAVLEWTARRGGLTVTLSYEFQPDDYLFHARGSVTGLPSGGLLLIGLGPRIRGVEADSVADIRSYGVVTKARSTESIGFGSLDPGERRELSGPFEWVAVKSKYFVAAVLMLEGDARFGGAVATGGPRSGREATDAHVTVSLAVAAGTWRHAAYVGPQEYRRLARIGHEFEDVNPYGWIFRPVIRPFANLIVLVLLWMHEVLRLQYGWVLVLFGLAVRIVLWPLNQVAMRSSTALQAVQPEMKALQDRYKNDPQKLQQEMMKLYKTHGVNPLGGCLPMLIPMPVLFALFFVFANTIEFRGVPFLWLPDLSRADPLYIIPLVMGLSMYGVSKVGQMGVPPNPQAKMMLYVMPVMFTVLFLNFSSGLNLYYAVSNIASIPQQWLIAKERLRRAGAPTKAA